MIDTLLLCVLIISDVIFNFQIFLFFNNFRSLFILAFADVLKEDSNFIKSVLY
jgi:hypothetical protein